jgi:N-acetylmuramoyl-L-alanine amidase
MKIYLTAGHQVIDGKGTGAHGFRDEAVEALKLRDDITALLRSRGVQVENEPPAAPLTKVIDWLRQMVTGSDIVCDIHFNSAGTAQANGTEVIVPEKYTKREIELAKQLGLAIRAALGTKLRSGKIIHAGVKTESETPHKAIGILNKPSLAHNVLIEIAFVSNYEEMTSLYPRGYNDLVKNIADVLQRFYA